MATAISERSHDLTELQALDPSRPELWLTHSWGPVFERLRAEAPILWVPESPFGGYWSINGYKAVQHVESLPDLYSSAWDKGGITIVDIMEDDDSDAFPMFIAMDRPQHTEQRRTVAPKFTPTEIAAMAESVRTRTAALFDTLPIGEEFDWVDKVSIELTTQMLAILFDFPWEDRRKLTFWSDWAGDLEAVMDPELRQKRLGILWECCVYFKDLWNQRVHQDPPRNDLISMMIHSPAMSQMSDKEYLGNLILLIVGGNDTTRNSMTGSVMAFNQFPEEFAKLRADPTLIPNAVSEVIRWQTPLAHMRRTALEDADLFGHQIKAGDKLVLWYASANRDESVFPDGERFIADRDNARRHLSFGYGIHRCVGARLAELQIQALFEELVKRRLTVEQLGDPTRIASPFINGYRALPVRLRQD